MRRLLLITCVLLVTAISVFSIQQDDSWTWIAYFASSPIPVVFGEKDDGLPEKLEIAGRITKVSFSRACGGVWWSGTMKVRLLKKVANYPHKNVYVVVNCLEDRQNKKKYLGKVVRLELLKLYPEYRELRDLDTFHFALIDNTIDSRGVPFYCTKAWRTDILNQ